MSLHDEQEIERLRAQADQLFAALAVSEAQLKDAMALLSDACCAKGDRLNAQVWLNRRTDLNKRYRGGTA
jgi:hypothetical protein